MTELQRLREAAGYSRQELAERAIVGETTVRNVENAAFRPTMTTRRKLLKALGVPFERHWDIFGDRYYPKFGRDAVKSATNTQT